MPTVAIIGAGELGGAVARALASRDCVSRILLIDAAGGVAAGKALDIQQSGAIDGFHTRLSGTDDVSAVTGAAVCVIADRAGAGQGEVSGEWNGDEGFSLLGRVWQYATNAPIVCAGVTQTDLMPRAVRELGIPRERLVGSAPDALASAIRAIVALEAQCSPSEVVVAVLGTPPRGFVVPWSEASIGGYALDRVLSQAQLAVLEARTARLWPPGPGTLGAAAARVTEAIVGSSRRSFNAFAVLDGEFGVRNTVGAMPLFLSPTGIASLRAPALNARERVRLQTALEGSLGG